MKWFGGRKSGGGEKMYLSQGCEWAWGRGGSGRRRSASARFSSSKKTRLTFFCLK
jgi:hypothetical protein